MFTESEEFYHESFLSPAAIRWANKRKSNNSNSVKAYLFPPLALKIHLILTELEAEFAGNLRIAELYDAVTTVVDFYKIRPKVSDAASNEAEGVMKQSSSHESDFLNGYVGADRSGGKEFAEFLALNSDRSGGDLQELRMRRLRLQTAFDDLCNHIRRKMIDARLASSTSDIDSFNTMVDMFGINYFKTNSFEKHVVSQNAERRKKYPDCRVDASGLRNYKQENSIVLMKGRKKEITRLIPATEDAEEARRLQKDPNYRQKEIKFWESKGALLPLRTEPKYSNKRK